MDKLDKLIQIIHNIKEEGEGAIANVVGDGEKSLGYNIETGTPPVDLRSRNTRGWNIFFKDMVRRNRKKKGKK
jgi:hypothetical protein